MLQFRELFTYGSVTRVSKAFPNIGNANWLVPIQTSLRRLAKEPKREEDYIFKARKELEEQEKLLEQDFKRGVVDYDNHWDGEHIRNTLKTSKTT